MYDCLIVCKSLTAVQRLNRLLAAHKCAGTIVRPPRQLSGSSCSYALQLKCACLADALELAQANAVRIDGTYRQQHGTFVPADTKI